jgi:NADH-ubiquinone oxidoreductase chain 6
MIGIFFLVSLGNSFSPSGFFNAQWYSINNNFNIALENLHNSLNSKLFYSISQVWDGNLAETSHITTIGNIIYTNFPLLILLTSIVLLLSMIGSILITIKQ